MKHTTRTLVCTTAIFVASFNARSAVTINEFQYDDDSTDDREFVELFNDGAAPVDISGWLIGGHDPTTTNASITLPAGASIAPGDYYVVGMTGVLNVDFVTAVALENDNETLELYDAGSNLVDAVFYEANAPFNVAGIATVGPQIAAQVGPGVWGNHQGVQTGAAAGTTLTTVARHLDGRDTNNNGRDFGLRPSTPGTSNQGAGLITTYTAPNVDAVADGTVVGGLTGSFKGGRVITPGVTDPLVNLNAIPAPPDLNKAIIAWDDSGGGNAVVSNGTFNNGGSFTLQVYLDTENIPTSTNASGVPFTGSETTFYGIGTIDAFTNLEDVTGATTLAAGTISANGATGVHWLYEKTSTASEKLYLIDANDGGNSNADNALGLDWTILTTIDLSATGSGWHTLSLSIAPDGAIAASFDSQSFSFSTIPGLVGEFSVGYRENTQDGADGTPIYLRPATFAAIPEPGSVALFGLVSLLGATRRRRAV
jgi:hypothetical protein